MNTAELLAGSYKLTDYTNISEFTYLRKLIPQKNGGFIAENVNGETKHSSLYTLNDELSDVNEINIIIPDDVTKADGYDMDFSISQNGNIAALYTLYDNGGITIPEDDEGFDYEEYYNNQKNYYGLCFYNADGSVKSYVNLGELSDFKGTEERVYKCSFVQASETTALISFSNGTVILCGNDGKTEKFPDYQETDLIDFIDFTLAADDTVYMTYSYYEDGDIYKNVRHIVPVDAEKKSYGDILTTIDYNDRNIYDFAIMSGYGDYCLLRSDYTDLWGIKPDGTTEKILNWADCDAMDMCIASI